MAVEAEALAWRQADIPDPHALVLRQEPLADAAIGALLLALEFGGDLGRPRGLGGGDRFLLQHAQGHEKSSSTQVHNDRATLAPAELRLLGEVGPHPLGGDLPTGPTRRRFALRNLLVQRSGPKARFQGAPSSCMPSSSAAR